MRTLIALAALLLALPASAQGIPFDPEKSPAPEDQVGPPPPPTLPPAARPASAPVVARARQRIGPRRLGGPRTGFTVLSAGAVDKLNEAFGEGRRCDYDYNTGRETCTSGDPLLNEGFPVVTQFGWQFEHRMFQAESGLTGVTEWILLVGGAERGLFLPSATFLAGVRAPGGFEIGVGPNVSLSGAAYAFAIGMNNEMGDVNLPLNAAVVLGQDGPRVSLLVGFNVSESRY